MYQAIFKRYEYKYLITKDIKYLLLSELKDYLELDKFGHTTIKNIYLDTDNYRLIRKSIEKPIYKEKIRLRCYNDVNSDDNIFVELKKKYKHVVYKRRIKMTEYEALNWLTQQTQIKNVSQIASEIDRFIKYYKTLSPKVLVSYERDAYYSNQIDNFRITFDENIMFRESDLSLKNKTWGTKIIEDDTILMEIKCNGGIPLWITEFLSRYHIYKTSFSKYGTAYVNFILPKLMEDKKNGSNI